MNNCKLIFLIFLLSSFFVACSKEKPKEEQQKEAHLGEVTFKATGSEEAQPYFKEGLLLLHSFEYADARDAFRKAQEIDPGFAMAYWGEAMTHNHPLWRQQDYEAGQEALNDLAPTPEARAEKAETELEKDLMQAAEILYGEGDKYERDKAYSEYMANLYEKYPGNHEVAAFYSLSILGAVPVGRDEEAYEKGAAIAKGILDENPNHPGALHYLIHSYDDPVHAHLAKQAADNYAEVAPDAAHALHMPSHIYVALGMWHEVVNSNIDSWNASVNRMKNKGLDNNARSYHALHWLLYGYLQQGRLEEAEQIMRDMVKYTEEKPSRQARAYLIDMKGNYLVETGRWNSDLANIEVDLEDLNIVSEAVYHFIEGMKAYHDGNADSLRSIIRRMEEERGNAAMLITESGVPMCSAGTSRSLPNQLDIDQAQVMELELKGLLAWLNGQSKGVDEYLSSAVELEKEISYSYGPPQIVKPSFELYGEWLLEAGRPKNALQQFDYALERGPKRVNALKGKMKAARMLGEEEIVKEVEQILHEIEEKAKGNKSEEKLS